MTTYEVTRMYFNDNVDNEVLETGLTLEEAQEWCRDPEGSSRTCEAPELVALTERCGPWFDGYDEE